MSFRWRPHRVPKVPVFLGNDVKGPRGTRNKFQNDLQGSDIIGIPRRFPIDQVTRNIRKKAVGKRSRTFPFLAQPLERGRGRCPQQVPISGKRRSISYLVSSPIISSFPSLKTLDADQTCLLPPSQQQVLRRHSSECAVHR